MNERELLEAAAKACRITLPYLVDIDVDQQPVYWNPLTSSADCAAMCAKLGVDTMWFKDQVECETHPTQDNSFGAIYSQFNNDREAAWRYAATGVAAKIGGMK